MTYEFEKWSISKLGEIIQQKQLDLSPPYQRNSVWSVKAQKKLIETIRAGQPIPNFFIRKIDKNKFEVVDGQQRTRSILAYLYGDIADAEGKTYKDLLPHEREAFNDYDLNITIIQNLAEGESIEAYFALVNSSGLRVNRPEIFHAEYHDTVFLKLITEMANLPCFSDLNLFTASKENRMEDVDFVSELLALLLHGITDKKDAVNEIFKKDISRPEYEGLSEKFKTTIRHFVRFDTQVQLRRTRYRQKNDFYTLFGFVYDNIDRAPEDLDYYYRTLVKIAKYISPSQPDCDPLKYYAINCVTQSNSKKARQSRLEFLNALFCNEAALPNPVQLELMHFFKMSEGDFTVKAGCMVLDATKINDPYDYTLKV